MAGFFARLFGPKLTNDNRRLGERVDALDQALYSAPESVTKNTLENVGGAVRNWLLAVQGYAQARAGNVPPQQGPNVPRQGPNQPNARRAAMNERWRRQRLDSAMRKLDAVLAMAENQLKNNALNAANVNIANANAVYKNTGGFISSRRFSQQRANLATKLTEAKAKVAAVRSKSSAAAASAASAEAQAAAEAAARKAAPLAAAANANLGYNASNENMNAFMARLNAALANKLDKQVNQLTNTNRANANYQRGKTKVNGFRSARASAAAAQAAQRQAAAQGAGN